MNIKSVDTPSTCYVPVISKVECLLCADTVEKLLNSVTIKFLGFFLGTRRAI